MSSGFNPGMESNHKTTLDSSLRKWIPYFVLAITVLLTIVATYIALLRAGSGLFVAGQTVTRDEFRNFVERLEIPQHYPGIQGIGFSMRLKPEEKDALVANM